MIASRGDVDAAIRVHQELQALLLQLETASINGLGTLLDELTQEIIRLVGTYTNADGPALMPNARVDQIMQRIIRELQHMNGAVAMEHRRLFDNATKAVRTKGVEAYATFGRTTLDRVQAAWDAFNQSGAADNLYRISRDKWLAEFGQTGNQLLSNIRQHMVRGQLAGEGQRDIARRIARDPLFRHEDMPGLGPDGKLPRETERMFTMGGRLGKNAALEGRANRIVRDAIAQAANDSHEHWTREAFGEDVRYVNVNPLDSRTTPECLDASRRRGMTRSEWDASGLGFAPRHYLCRSVMFALPEGARADETGEPKEVSIEDRGGRLALAEA